MVNTKTTISLTVDLENKNKAMEVLRKNKMKLSTYVNDVLKTLVAKNENK